MLYFGLDLRVPISMVSDELLAMDGNMPETIAPRICRISVAHILQFSHEILSADGTCVPTGNIKKIHFMGKIILHCGTQLTNSVIFSYADRFP